MPKSAFFSPIAVTVGPAFSSFMLIVTPTLSLTSGAIGSMTVITPLTPTPSTVVPSAMVVVPKMRNSVTKHKTDFLNMFSLLLNF